MICTRSQLGPGVTLVSCRHTWKRYASHILSAVDSAYGGASGASITPPPDYPSLRDTLRDIAPPIFELAEQVSDYLKQSPCLVFDRLHLQDYDVDAQRKLLFALSVAIGVPTATDQKFQRVVWDIKPRSLGSQHFATYSEHNNTADLHTDSQYFPLPEKYILNYVCRAARDGQGETILCDGRTVYEHLEASPRARWVLEVLSNEYFPFQIPTSFTSSAQSGTVELTFAPIFSAHPLIRFRKDTILNGLQHCTACNDAVLRQALETFLRFLTEESQTVRCFLGDDGAYLLDNHVALHGRTGFGDRDRHLLRIRMN